MVKPQGCILPVQCPKSGEARLSSVGRVEQPWSVACSHMGLNWHRPLMRNGNLRGQAVADLHSAATTIANVIDTEIEAALVGLDAEYAALCSELVLV